MQNQNSEKEIEFLFNFALAIYGVAFSFSAFTAHYASIFRPADILFDGKLENFIATVVYGLCLLITVFVFAGCWYRRNWLWNSLSFFGAKHITITKIIRVIFAFVLGISPYLVYYLVYWLRVMGRV